MADLRDGLSSRELTEWAAYERVAGPLGAERLDILFAMLAMTIANSQPRSRRGGQRYKLSDFLIPWDGRQETDPMTMRRNFYAVTRGGAKG